MVDVGQVDVRSLITCWNGLLYRLRNSEAMRWNSAPSEPGAPGGADP